MGSWRPTSTLFWNIKASLHIELPQMPSMQPMTMPPNSDNGLIQVLSIPKLREICVSPSNMKSICGNVLLFAIAMFMRIKTRKYLMVSTSP